MQACIYYIDPRDLRNIATGQLDIVGIVNGHWSLTNAENCHIA